MRIKLPYHALTNSEADVSATVDMQVLFDHLYSTNVGTTLVQLKGISFTLDALRLTHHDNLGWMTPEQEVQLAKANELIEGVIASMTLDQEE